MCIRFSHTVCKLMYASVCVCSLNCTEEVTNYAGMCSLVRCFLISWWSVWESSLISPSYLYLPTEVSLSLAHTHTYTHLFLVHTLCPLSLFLACRDSVQSFRQELYACEHTSLLSYATIRSSLCFSLSFPPQTKEAVFTCIRDFPHWAILKYFENAVHGDLV